jgi:GGDEF domain-containing protein
LAGTEGDVFGWLQTRLNSRTLEIEGLVDRQRECLFCHSAHPRFTDRGDTADVFSAFGELHIIATELFVHNLEWLIAQVQRYPDVQFAVLGLSFPNVPELVHVMGHGRTLSLVESVSARLRDLLRTPDLSTRMADNRIWLLLPHTDSHGLQGLLVRIKKSALLTRQADGQELVCRFAEFVSTDLRESDRFEFLSAFDQARYGMKTFAATAAESLRIEESQHVPPVGSRRQGFGPIRNPCRDIGPRLGGTQIAQQQMVTLLVKRDTGGPGFRQLFQHQGNGLFGDHLVVLAIED